MDDSVRENLRRRLVRLLDALDSLSPSPAAPALQRVPVGPPNQRARARRPRTIRPVRAWARLTREDILGVRPRRFSS